MVTLLMGDKEFVCSIDMGDGADGSRLLDVSASILVPVSDKRGLLCSGSGKPDSPVVTSRFRDN